MNTAAARLGHWSTLATSAVAGLALLAGVPAAFSAEAGPPIYSQTERAHARLPEGQNEAEFRFPAEAFNPTSVVNYILLVDGGITTRGAIEVEITLADEVWESPYDFTIDGMSAVQTGVSLGSSGPGRVTRFQYREIVLLEDLLAGGREFDIEVTNRSFPYPLDGSNSEFSWDCTLGVKLRRIHGCSMSATVTGDLSAATYGDVAYFNAHEGAVAHATGSLMDPAMLEMMGDFIEGMEEMNPAAASDTDGGSSPGREDFEQFVREQNQGGTEGFGVTLVDHKSGDDTRFFSGLTTLVGGFTVEAAGTGDIDFDRTQVSIEIPLTRLTVVPGTRFEGSLNKAKFEWKTGDDGYAEMGIRPISEHFIEGWVKGEVYGPRGEDGRILRISIHAKFTALRGALACNP